MGIHFDIVGVWEGIARVGVSSVAKHWETRLEREDGCQCGAKLLWRAYREECGVGGAMGEGGLSRKGGKRPRAIDSISWFQYGGWVGLMILDLNFLIGRKKKRKKAKRNLSP